MKRVIAILIAASTLLMTASGAIIRPDSEPITQLHEKENHNCIVYGIGYFPDLTYIEVLILIYVILPILQTMVRITDIIFLIALAGYTIFLNNIPTMKISYHRFIETAVGGVGYMGACGRNGTWGIVSENFTDLFDVVIYRFFGLWMQLPVIIRPMKYPIFLDVFVGYAGDVYVTWGG